MSKPSAQDALIAGRPVQLTATADRAIVWVAHGEVWYVVLAANGQLLEKAVDARAMTGPVSPSPCRTHARPRTATGIIPR